MSINEALRAHVTSAKFVLTLGSTHIAALARIAADLQDNRSTEEMLKDYRAGGSLRDVDPPIGHPLRPAFRAPGVGGLLTRGLVTHTMPYPRKGRTNAADWRPSDIWTITPAGQAVITLLQEAGIWQEYTSALAPATPARPARGRRAA